MSLGGTRRWGAVIPRCRLCLMDTFRRIPSYTPLKVFTMVGNNLVPELSISNLENSLTFYCDILGFKIEFERAEDRFAYLSFHGSELMLEEDSGRQSPWNILPFDYPR